MSVPNAAAMANDHKKALIAEFLKRIELKSAETTDAADKLWLDLLLRDAKILLSPTVIDLTLADEAMIDLSEEPDEAVVAPAALPKSDGDEKKKRVFDIVMFGGVPGGAPAALPTSDGDKKMAPSFKKYLEARVAWEQHTQGFGTPGFDRSKWDELKNKCSEALDEHEALTKK